MKIEQILNDIKTLTAVQLAELVESLQGEFGISSDMLSVGTGGSSSSGNVEEKAEVCLFKVTINNVPADKKINLIKTIKTVLGIGLGESKTMADSAETGAEVIVKTGMQKTEAEELAKQLKEAGATVVISEA